MGMLTLLSKFMIKDLRIQILDMITDVKIKINSIIIKKDNNNKCL